MSSREGVQQGEVPKASPAIAYRETGEIGTMQTKEFFF
jgi:hypothetical protein